MDTPNFIPDNKFIPDSTKEPSGGTTPDFIPDNQFQSDEDRYGTPIEQAKTGVEALARGASFGASDLAETKMGISTPENIKGRMEENPVISTIGQMAGSIAPLAATGGASAPAEALLGAGTAAARVAAMGLEGAAFGAGNVVTDYALGDPNLNAQKILSEVGMGAALGMGLGALSKGAEALIPAATSKLSDSVDKLISKFSDIPDNFSGDWAKEFSTGLKGVSEESGIRKMSENLGDIYKESKSAAKSMYQEALPKGIESPLDDTESYMKFKEGGEKFSQVSDLYHAHDAALNDFQKSFMRELSTPSGNKRYVIDPAKVSSFFRNNSDAGQDLRNQIFNNFLNSAQSLSKASENYAGFKAAEGSISDRVNQLAKEHSELKDVAKAISSGIPQSRGRFNELVGAGIATAAGIPHPVVAGVIGAIEALKAIRNPYELGSTINNTFSKIKAISKLTDRAANKISNMSKSVFNSSGKGAVESGAISNTGYQTRVDRINQLTQDPQSMIDHLDKSTNAMHEAAPNISQGIHSSMMSGVNFLASKIPRPSTQFPLSDDFEPSEAQKDSFNRYYNTINNPIGVLSEVKAGSVSNEQIEALQAVYPHLLQEMRSNMLQAMESKKALDLPYSVKMSIAKFLGQSLDANMTTQAIASNQMAMHPQLPQQNQQPKSKSTLGGLKELKSSQMAQTQTQKLERDES